MEPVRPVFIMANQSRHIYDLAEADDDMYCVCCDRGPLWGWYVVYLYRGVVHPCRACYEGWPGRGELAGVSARQLRVRQLTRLFDNLVIEENLWALVAEYLHFRWEPRPWTLSQRLLVFEDADIDDD